MTTPHPIIAAIADQKEQAYYVDDRPQLSPYADKVNEALDAAIAAVTPLVESLGDARKGTAEGVTDSNGSSAHPPSLATHTLECAYEYQEKGCVCGAEQRREIRYVTAHELHDLLVDAAEVLEKPNSKGVPESHLYVELGRAISVVWPHIAKREPVSVDLAVGAKAIGETLFTQFGYASAGDYSQLSKACAEAWGLAYDE